MDITHHDFPLPSWAHLLLVSLVGVSGYLHHLHHSDITFFLNVFTACCALISYGYKFINWLIKIKTIKTKRK